MSAPRPIQNFRGFRGLWWGPPCAAAESLSSALGRLGASFELRPEAEGDEAPGGRDILFIDGDHAFDPLRARPPGGEARAPVIGVVGSEAPSRLKALLDAGATALLRKPIHPSTVYSALFLAVNNHQRFRELAGRIAAHDRRHGGRRYVIRAVVRLVQERGLCDEQAFALIRRESMRRRMGIEDYARALCEHHHQQETTNALDQDLPAGERGGPGVDGLDGDLDWGLGGRPDQTRRA